MILRKQMTAIHPDPTQPRFVFKQEELQSLAQNIQANGLIDPIRCFERNGECIIFDGERRYRALLLLGLTETDVLIVKEPPAKKLSLLQASIDLHREGFNGIERGKLFERIMRENAWSANEAAKQLSISQSTVCEHLQLLRLAPPLQEAVAKGLIPVSKGVIISREPDHGKQVELAKTYAKAPRQQLKEQVSEPSGDQAKPKRASFTMPGGIVSVQGVGLALQDAIDLLLATAKELKRGLSDSLDISTIQLVLKQRHTMS